MSSLLARTASEASASSNTQNSQTVPLLASAVNIDPRPLAPSNTVPMVGGSALLPEEGPSGTRADIDRTPSSMQVSVYVVRAGDTLSQIADMYDVSVNTIVWANDIKGGVIHEGDQLVILPITGIQHTVVRGETLASVAKKYKADAGEVAQYNDLAPNDDLAVGQVVIIPHGEVAPPPASTGTTSKAKTTNAKKIAYEPYLGGSGPSIPGFFGWPIEGGIITQSLHGWNAVDIGAPRGTSIYAAADGTVMVARSSGWNGGYGNYIVIAHTNGTQTLYSHASKLLVNAGEAVVKGQAIATVGATGLTTGPHLHFEVRGAANPFSSLSVGN